MNELKINITQVEKSIAEKESYLALAHTRLGNRCQRPGLELTHDLVEISLVREVYELQDIVAKLQQTLLEVVKMNFISFNNSKKKCKSSLDIVFINQIFSHRLRHRFVIC